MFKEKVIIKVSLKNGKYEVAIHSSVVNENGEIVITGTLSGASGSLVSIRIPVYDRFGNRVDNAYDSIHYLRDGESWRFEAKYYANKRKGDSFTYNVAKAVIKCY